jgi:hypothetical protein
MIKITTCIFCHNTATEKHHIIFRSQGGSDNPQNLADLCFNCHFEIHHGKNIKLKKAIMGKCYEQAMQDLDKCWKGKFKPKVVNLLEFRKK